MHAALQLLKGFCVFGDTVNTTARHETTGKPGMIQCSADTRAELSRTAGGEFGLQPRGVVEMKGKGKLRTFWLTASSQNTLVNARALSQLEREVQEMLESTSSFGRKFLGQTPSSPRTSTKQLFKSKMTAHQVAALLIQEDRERKASSKVENFPNARHVDDTLKDFSGKCPYHETPSSGLPEMVPNVEDSLYFL